MEQRSGFDGELVLRGGEGVTTLLVEIGEQGWDFGRRDEERDKTAED